MRLLHPFMPFLTEEIWQQLPKPSGAPQSIMITLYPVRDVRFHDDASEASMALVQKIIVAVRSIRTERNIPTLGAADGAAGGHRRLQEDDPRGLQDASSPSRRRCGEVRVRRSGASFSGEFVLSKTAMAMAGDVEVMVPLEGLVDPKAELAKLQKDSSKLDKRHRATSKQARRPELLVARARSRCSTRTRRSWPSWRRRSPSSTIAIDRLK